MPASAYALLGVFTALSALAGWLAAWTVGPRRWWAGIGPAVAAFAALYLVGHRIVLRIGPQVDLFGWEVSLPFDVGVALASALAGALVQRLGLQLLEPEERSARRDGLA